MNKGRIYPKVYLAIDNCFASKRWTSPAQWMPLIQELGINHVEASADNECDPLYSTKIYLKRWLEEIGEESVKTGVKVCNLYSGHGTYATLGLAHPDISVRDRMQHEWLIPMIDLSSRLKAGLGFYCHAFDQNLINDKRLYFEAVNDLYYRLSELAIYASKTNNKTIGIEQMYTPFQIPWTVKGTIRLLKKVKAFGNRPFYITIDLGHQSGQRKFLKPGSKLLRKQIQNCERKSLWLGPQVNNVLYESSLSGSPDEQETIYFKIMENVRSYSHLFSEWLDGDPFYWLRNLGRYSPIIHLQQTDGSHSYHLPFTEEYNKKGLITGETPMISF